MKKNHYRFTILRFFLMISFIGLLVYYHHFLQTHTYTGIRLAQIDSDWYIKKIEVLSNIKVGDRVLSIQPFNQNEKFILDRFLILTNVDKLLIDSGESAVWKKIPIFKKSIFYHYLLVSVASIVLVITGRKFKVFRGRQEQRFSFFLVLSSLTLMSLVPSSIGNSLSRLIVTLFICSLPFYFFQFINRYHQHRQSIFYRVLKAVLILWGIGTVALSLVNLFLQLPYLIKVYLAVGFFYMALLLLLVVMFYLYLRISDQTESQVNFPAVTLLSLLPIYGLYIFPKSYQISFVLPLLYLFFPILVIYHLLLTSGFLKGTYQLTKRDFLIICSLLFGFLTFSLGYFSNQVSGLVIAVYSILFFYYLMPLFLEVYQLITSEKHTNDLKVFIAVEQERERVAETIHDTVIQEVTFLKRELEEKKLPQATVMLQLEDVIYSLRELCSEIYPLMLKEVGLRMTLTRILNDLEMKYPVEIKKHFDWERVDKDLENFILRTVRELVINAIKHSDSRRVFVSIQELGNRLVITVKNSGSFKDGLDLAQHRGLIAIKEKVELYGGNLTILTNEVTEIKIELNQIGD